jgi:hypothetical protein
MPVVGTQARLSVLARLGEGRRVAYYDVEALALGGKFGHDVERVAPPRGHARGQAVALGRKARPLQRRRARIDQHHAARPRRRGAQAECANVAKHVEYPRTGGQPGHPVAVRALVEEEAGLLAVQGIDWKAHAAFHNLGREQAHLLRQVLQGSGGAVVSGNHGAQRQDLAQRCRDLRQQAVHSGRIGLRHSHITKAVHDQSRQPVGFGMDETVEWRVAKARPQLRRVGQAGMHPACVNRRRGIGIEQPCCDKAVRVEREGAESPALRALNADRRTWLPAAVLGRARKLVAERPRIARPQPAVMPWTQADERPGSHPVNRPTAGGHVPGRDGGPCRDTCRSRSRRSAPRENSD